MSSRAFLLIHGKDGGPNDPESKLQAMADFLEDHGTVSYNEYPWGYTRIYDRTAAEGMQEIVDEANRLRETHDYVYMLGHSIAGNLLLDYAREYKPSEGIILLNPAHHVGNNTFVAVSGWSLQKAERLIADGKGDEPDCFVDYNANEYLAITCTPKQYVSYLHPESGFSLHRMKKKDRGYAELFGNTVKVLWLSSIGDRTQEQFGKVCWPLMKANPESVAAPAPTDWHGFDEMHLPAMIEWYKTHEKSQKNSK